MNWSDIAGVVGKAAPILGTLVGGPAGGAIGALISGALGVANTPDAVSQALATNPDAAVKLAEIEKDKTLGLEQLAQATRQAEIKAESDEDVAVNTTMQAEAKAEHWPTYTWRPFIGFMVGVNIAASSLLVLGTFGGTLFGSALAATAVGSLPGVLGALAGINATVLPILGIASWFRGKAQADSAQVGARG